MNKILVPTDFSEHSNYALQNGAFLAKKTGGQLLVLHIIRDEKKTNQEDIETKFSALRANKDLKNVRVEFVIEKGSNVSKVINNTAVNVGADLIVMGSNGASNTEEILLGSTTENVIRKSGINVLTIKREIISFEIKHIVFPSDFSKEAYSIFDSVKEFAKTFGATVHLLSVNKSDKPEVMVKADFKIDKFVKEFKLEEEGIKYERYLCTNPSAEFGILNYSIDKNIDMIAIGTHGKGVLKKLIQESTSQSLVRDAFKPVLTMRFK